MASISFGLAIARPLPSKSQGSEGLWAERAPAFRARRRANTGQATHTIDQATMSTGRRVGLRCGAQLREFPRSRQNLPMTKLIRILCCSALLALFTTTASQAAGPWSARLRATYLETVDKSDAFTALGINFAENAVAVSDKFIPEIDVDYAFTDTWSAELVLTIPQKHKVTLAGIGQLGTFKHLPPTLLAKYRANPGGAVRPYLGAGLNFTLIWGGNLSVAGVPLALDNFSVGLAAQGGVDIKLDDRWTMNVDVKRAALRTDVSAGGNKLTEARLDPWLYSVGASHAF